MSCGWKRNRDGAETCIRNRNKKYFQIIELKEASYFNDIVIAIYQLYEYLQTKEIIDRIPFRYEYYLKKKYIVIITEA